MATIPATLDLDRLQATYEGRRDQFAGFPDRALQYEMARDLLDLLGELRRAQTELAAARAETETHHRYIAALNGGRGCRLHACQNGAHP
jgi:hypothetical protein